MVSPPPPHTPQGYLGIEARRKRDARVRALLLPIAEQLAACFGLQRVSSTWLRSGLGLGGRVRSLSSLPRASGCNEHSATDLTLTPSLGLTPTLHVTSP